MKIISKYIGIIFIVMISLNSYSQQEPLYTQYYNNFSLINPAYAGSHGYFTNTFSVRSQWVDEPGSPKTKAMSVHGATGKNVGLGLSVVNDKVFVLNETHVYADFSYSIKASENATLAFGLKAGASFLNVDLLGLEIYDDPLFNQNISKTNPNIGVGAFFFTDRFYASLSTMNILKNTHFKRKNNIVSSASENMVYYLSSGYVFDLGKELKLKPSFLVRGVKGSPVSTDVAVNLLWKVAEFGISHRFKESISGLFQIRLNDSLKLGYTYSGYTQNIGNYNSGSHEVSLIFDINKKSNHISRSKVPFNW